MKSVTKVRGILFAAVLASAGAASAQETTLNAAASPAPADANTHGVRVLFFLKGSRVREYQKENLAILAAPEGELVDISYSRRWVTPGVRVPVGEGGVIVFADSPYEHFVPVRFAVVRDVEDTDERIRITVRLGPFVCCDDPGALDARWPNRPAPDRPGLRFLVEDDNPGLFTPSGPADIDAAWRTAVDGLHIGHDVSGRVKAACTKAGVTCVHAQRGRRSVVDELVGALDGEAAKGSGG